MLNKFLQNQVRKHLGECNDLPPNFANLLNAISNSYDHHEKDRKLLERSVEISSTEMIELNNNLKEKSRELSSLFDSVDEVLYSMDIVNYKTTQISPSCEKLYGYTPDEFYADPNLWVTVMHPDDMHLVQEYSARILMDKLVESRCRIIRKDQSIRWVESSITPTLDKQGQLIRLNGIVRDVTEKKKAEAEIKALNESLEQKVKERTAELERANNELESFSYSVSHDLRAPLRVINGYGKMLLKSQSDKLDKRAQEDLQVIMSNATHMGSLIDNLLDFSRLGRSAVVKKSVNMTDMVKVVIEEVKAGVDALAEIKFQEFEPTHCDPVLMKQVWTNLISNAFKYSRKSEKPLIEIGSTGLNGHQTYYVKDNGAGFDMQHADKLFAVFQRLHKVTEYEGTGVGLALAQRIITKHGGKIWAHGKVNEGATFYFTLSK